MFLLYGILAVALVADFRHFRIPNVLILVGIMAGIGYTAWSDGLWYLALLEGLILLLVLYPFYMIGAFGGGDVKLLAVVGIFLGLEMGVNVAVLSLMTGAVCSVFKILYELFRKKWLSFKHLYIHFSLPIFIGTILVQFGGITWITF